VWRHVSLLVPPVVYAALIFHFSSESNPLPALTSVIWDKALHISEYAGFAFLVCRALRGVGVAQWRSFTLALLIASAYGTSDEWHQLFVPGRDSDVLDWTADTIGGAFGVALYSAVVTLIGFVP
jgi:VanZ family protein